MLDDIVIEQIAVDLELYIKEFVENRLKDASLLKEAANAVRVEVRRALEEGGYDTTAPMILAIISKCHVVLNDKGDEIEFVFVHDFKGKDIVTEWENKDGEPQFAEINSLDIAEFIDSGRKAYTIVGTNTDHKLLAIPQDGEPYDPSKKSNIRTKMAKVPELARTGFKERAEAALASWVYRKWQILKAEFNRNIESIAKRNIKA